jgi:hypothetical protein
LAFFAISISLSLKASTWLSLLSIALSQKASTWLSLQTLFLSQKAFTWLFLPIPFPDSFCLDAYSIPA